MTPLIENHQSVKTDRCINVISRKRIKGVRYLILTTLIVATVIRIIVSIHLITMQYFIHSIRLFLWKTAPRNFTRIAVLTFRGQPGENFSPHSRLLICAASTPCNWMLCFRVSVRH